MQTNDTKPQCEVAALKAQNAALVEALREIAEPVTTDARELARKVMHENNHRVTGTESERIGNLLQLADRQGRLARAAIAAARGGKSS